MCEDFVLDFETLSDKQKKKIQKILMRKTNEISFYMDDNKERIIDALSQVPEEYLVSVEEIALALKIMNNRMKEFLDSGRKLSEKDWERIFNNL